MDHATSSVRRRSVHRRHLPGLTGNPSSSEKDGPAGHKAVYVSVRACASLSPHRSFPRKRESSPFAKCKFEHTSKAFCEEYWVPASAGTTRVVNFVTGSFAG